MLAWYFFLLQHSGDMARETLGIYATLDDHQVDHKSKVMEAKGNIVKKFVSILINPESIHSYITPKVVENCSL